MKITVNLTWIVFWIVLGFLLFHMPEPPWMIQERECAKNGGVIINDGWGRTIECKIYKK